jgi:O-antigen ligase
LISSLTPFHARSFHRMWPFALAITFSVVVALGALYAPRYCVLGVLAIIVFTAAMSDLAVGVAGLAVLMFFEVVPGISGGSLAKPYGLVLVLSWLGSIARKEKMPLLVRDRPILAYLLVGFVVWSAASTTWAVDPSAAESRAVQMALVVALVFVVYSAVKTEKDFLLIVWAFLTGAWLVCIDSILTSHVESGGRLTSGVLDPNYLAATLACSVVVASFLLLRTTGIASVVIVVYIGVDFIALALTESRGGLIAAGAALVTACFVAGPVRAQVIALAVLLGAVGLVYFVVFAPASARARVTTISTTSSSGRADEWSIALRIASQHPLAGVGIGNFPSVENQYFGSGLNLITATEDVNTRRPQHLPRAACRGRCGRARPVPCDRRRDDRRGREWDTLAESEPRQERNRPHRPWAHRRYGRASGCLHVPLRRIREGALARARAAGDASERRSVRARTSG